MSKIVDMVGERHGRLTVLSREPNSNSGKAKWLCICECERYKVVSRSDLISKKITSCGCYRKETASLSGKSCATHGDTNTRLHRIWCGMKQRANYQNGKQYDRYGGRGISICDEWASDYTAFKHWALQSGYADKLTIDRINNDGDYAPNNCKWSTYKEQENNRCNNTIIEVAGETHTLSEWSDISGISAATLSFRLKHGWQLEELFMPVNLNNKNIRKEIICRV